MQTTDGQPALDRGALEALLARTEEQLEAYLDPAHHTFLDVYLARAHALHALGAEPDAVLRALHGAAGCYAAHQALYLERWPAHRIRTRRLLPLELALIVRDEASLEMTRGPVGLDAVEILAGVEPEAVTEELRELTGWFRLQRLESASDFAGALAVLYAAGLSAVGRSDADALTGYRAAVGTLLDAGARWVPGARGGLARLLTAHRALGALRPANAAAVLEAIAAHTHLHEADFAARAAEDPEVLLTAAGQLDTTSLALASAAIACGHDIGAALAAIPVPAGPDPLALIRRYGAALVG